MADAVFYLLCAPVALGGCCPGGTLRQAKTVYSHFDKWCRGGRLRKAYDRLRAVCEAEGRDWEPSGAVIDSQAVKGTGSGQE